MQQGIFNGFKTAGPNSPSNPNLLSKPKPPQKVQAPVYIHGGGYGDLRGAIGSLETSKTLKQGVRIVDTLEVLTVNWLLGRLVNTLAGKANGADVRR